MDKVLILKEIKKYLDIKKDTDFALFLGIKQTTLAMWYKRKTFDIELIFKKCEWLNAEWLLTGKGSMLKKEVVAGTNISQKVIGNDNITTGGSNNAILSTNNDKVIKELKTEVERLRSLLIEKEKQLTEKEKQITKLIDKLS